MGLKEQIQFTNKKKKNQALKACNHGSKNKIKWTLELTEPNIPDLQLYLLT